MYAVTAGMPTPIMFHETVGTIVEAMDLADSCWEHGFYTSLVTDVDRPRDLLYYVEDSGVRSPDERTARKKQAYAWADARRRQADAYKTYESNINWSNELDLMFSSFPGYLRLG